MNFEGTHSDHRSQKYVKPFKYLPMSINTLKIPYYINRLVYLSKIHILMMTNGLFLKAPLGQAIRFWKKNILKILVLERALKSN